MELEDFAADAVELHRRIVGVVFAVCGDRSLAEESAQEALAKAWSRVEDGHPPRSSEAWSIRVALNWSYSQLRRSGAERRAVERLAGSSTAEAVVAFGRGRYADRHAQSRGTRRR